MHRAWAKGKIHKELIWKIAFRIHEKKTFKQKKTNTHTHPKAMENQPAKQKNIEKCNL